MVECSFVEIFLSFSSLKHLCQMKCLVRFHAHWLLPAESGGSSSSATLFQAVSLSLSFFLFSSDVNIKGPLERVGARERDGKKERKKDPTNGLTKPCRDIQADVYRTDKEDAEIQKRSLVHAAIQWHTKNSMLKPFRKKQPKNK